VIFYVNHQYEREDQNAEFQMHGENPVLIAIQDIEKGEEIFSDYGG